MDSPSPFAVALHGCFSIGSAPAGGLAAIGWSGWALALYFLLLLLLLLTLLRWPRDDDDNDK